MPRAQSGPGPKSKASKVFVSFVLNGPLGETTANCELEIPRIQTYAQIKEVEELLVQKYKDIGTLRVAIISWQILEG